MQAIDEISQRFNAMAVLGRWRGRHDRRIEKDTRRAQLDASRTLAQLKARILELEIFAHRLRERLHAGAAGQQQVRLGLLVEKAFLQLFQGNIDREGRDLSRRET